MPDFNHHVRWHYAQQARTAIADAVQLINADKFGFLSTEANAALTSSFLGMLDALRNAVTIPNSQPWPAPTGEPCTYEVLNTDADEHVGYYTNSSIIGVDLDRFGVIAATLRAPYEYRLCTFCHHLYPECTCPF